MNTDKTIAEAIASEYAPKEAFPARSLTAGAEKALYIFRPVLYNISVKSMMGRVPGKSRQREARYGGSAFGGCRGKTAPERPVNRHGDSVTIK